MREAVENPFERYDLDPTAGIAAITERMRELIADATSDEERRALQAAWEDLTLHPARRFQAALLAHPETREALGTPPPLVRRRPAPATLDIRDLAAPPSAVEALRATTKETETELGLALAEDPLLAE